MNPKLPMTPAEFDVACRTIRRRVPGLSETSGGRSVERNKQVGGHPESKHILGMARDFVGSSEDMKIGAAQCEILGLTYLLHDVGSGNHLHVQGLPKGEIPMWWRQKYLEED